MNPWRFRTALFVAVLVVFGLGACSDADDDGGDAAGGDTDVAAETASPDEDAEALVFAECMRENGIDMPDPGPGQDGFFDAFHGVVDNYDQATITDAISACEGFFPTYVAGGHGADSEATLALAECLREQGLDVPDTLFEDGALREVDQDELRAAMEACRDVVAGGGQ